MSKLKLYSSVAPMILSCAAGQSVGAMMMAQAGGAATAPRPIANLGDVQNFNVVWNQWEATRGCLYDSAAYPAAGIAQLTFFNVGYGGGTGFGGSAKTLSDTNVQLNSQLPSNQMFIVESVDLMVQPATPSVAGYAPANYDGNVTVMESINDVWNIRRTGNFAFSIGNKTYLQEAPLMVFPPLGRFNINAAVADTTTAAGNTTVNAQTTRVGAAEADGTLYVLDPNNLLVPPVTTFGVTLGWPEGLQTIKNPARIFVRLNGTNLRKIQ
jgi:hypothetical protein